MYDPVVRQLTADRPALVAPDGRLSAWTSWLEASMKALGLGLIGLCVITYLDIWAYQGINGLALRVSAATGEARSTPDFRYSPGQSMGWLEIPRLGISAIVAHGDDDRTLMRSVGHIPGTAFPGEVGNVGLAGHRDTFFRALQGIETFDTIRLVMPDRVIAYRVVDIGIVRPSQIEVLNPTPSPSLTLVTCYPFEYVGSAPYRYVFRAEELRLEEGEPAPRPRAIH